MKFLFYRFFHITIISYLVIAFLLVLIGISIYGVFIANVYFLSPSILAAAAVGGIATVLKIEYDEYYMRKNISINPIKDK